MNVPDITYGGFKQLISSREDRHHSWSSTALLLAAGKEWMDLVDSSLKAIDVFGNKWSVY